MSGYWYLATPYALYPQGRQVAYEEARDQTMRLLLSDIPVYSPIVHNHPLSLLPEMDSKDGDFDFWVRTVDQPMMEGAGGLLVCMMEGWDKSKGIAYEIEVFRRHRKPVYYYDPLVDVSSLSPSIYLPTLDRPLEVVLIEEVEWQDSTFPLSTSKSRAVHLSREAKELESDPENPLEMADVLLLLSHLARGKGGPNVSLTKAILDKQSINRSRVWSEPDSQGVVEHIRGEE